VTCAGIVAGFAGVAAIDLVPMGPTIIGVGGEVASVGVGSSFCACLGCEFDFDTSKVGLRQVEFGDGLYKLLREVTVGCGQVGDGSTVRGCGGGEVDNGFGNVVLVCHRRVGVVVACLLGCKLGVMIVLVGFSECGFEVGPHLFDNWMVSPFTAGLGEHTSGKHQSVCNCDDLCWGVGGSDGCC